MNIYLLTRNGEIGFDEFDSKVIRASTESEARDIANAHTGDEGHVWSDEKKVCCEVVHQDGDPQVILASFNAV